MQYAEEDILALIAARLCGEKLSAQEEQALEKWLDHSEAHRKNYDYYRRLLSDRRERLKVWDKVQIPADFAQKNFCYSYHRRVLFKPLLRYAAVVVLFFLVGGIVTYLVNFPEVGPEEATVLAKEDFAPGIRKAQLKLEDGSVIILGDSITSPVQEGISVKNGEVLQYNKDSAESETSPVYHTLVVNRGCEFQLVLPDGTKVWMNSESELRYPSSFTAAVRKVFLKGEAYFEVAHRQRHPFVVEAAGCDIKVLGTEFNVSAYQEEDQVVTTLVRGNVAFRAHQKEGILQPGQQCIVNRQSQTTQVKNVDVNQFISWKNGLFVFDHIRMEELAKQISRWYDIEVLFPDEKVKEISFTGAMERYRPVSYIVRLLNETNTVECRLEENMLVLRLK